MDYHLFLDDALARMSAFEDHSFDAIICDPPYNLAPHSTGNIAMAWRKDFNNGIATWDEGVFEVEALVTPFRRLLKQTGTIFAFTSFNLIGEWHRCFDPLFDTFQMVVWHKTNPPPKLFKAGFLNSCEYIICLWDKKHTWNFGKQSEMHNFVQGPICQGKERLDHRTQKPLWLMEWMVQLCTHPGDLILDPYMGVGSTGEAALRLGRRFVGVDLDPHSFQQAQKRLDHLGFTLPLFAEVSVVPVDAPDTSNVSTKKAPLQIPGNDEVAPASADTIRLCPSENLRVCLLTYTQEVQESLQRTQQLFAPNCAIYRDRLQICCKEIQKKSDALNIVLSEILKIQRVDIGLHSCLKIEKEYFQQNVERIVFPFIETQGNQTALSYNDSKRICVQLTTLERCLASLSDQICEFCRQVDPDIDIYHFSFVSSKKG